MRNVLACCACLVVAGIARAESLKGEYLETRNAEVWVGECFANSEIGIRGDKGILSWKVTDGAYNGVDLDGLKVVAVVFGDKTFGMREKVETRTLFLVDEKADSAQREALMAMAKDLAGETIQQVIGVRSAKIDMDTAYCNGLGCAHVNAGDVKIRTRCLRHTDSVCSHERMAYPPLAKVNNAYCAFSLENKFTGEGFNATFSDANSRSAVIGSFAL